MANCAIVGINWGDEGKGRMVDYLTGQYDVVVRYQGGGNAGHTVINDMGKFALHLLPSGVFRPGVMNILGNGVALDCENLVTEMETIRAAGVSISPENLMVSHRASLLLPWHRELDALEEARLKDKMYGSTKQGIAPFYSDKYQKKTIQAGELLYPDRLMAHLQDLLEWKNLILQKVYGAKGYTMAEMTAWLETYAAQVRPYVAEGAGRGQGHSVRGTAGRAARPGLRYLSLYHLLQHHCRLRAYRRGAAHRKDRRSGGRGKGVFLLRGRGPVHLRVVRCRRGKAAGGRRGVWRQDGPPPPGRPH